MTTTKKASPIPNTADVLGHYQTAVDILCQDLSIAAEIVNALGLPKTAAKFRSTVGLYKNPDIPF
jgi:hypothetical protein